MYILNFGLEVYSIWDLRTSNLQESKDILFLIYLESGGTSSSCRSGLIFQFFLAGLHEDAGLRTPVLTTPSPHDGVMA